MSDAEAKESKRGRVRRLLQEPLVEYGFRRSKLIPKSAFETAMAAMMDDLTYMSDDGLEVLRCMLVSKGRGKNRDIWPSRATITGLAELVQPRPVAEIPALLRWFRSVEGPKAQDEGILVETYEYFQKFKRPPVEGLRAIRDRAAENRRNMDLALDRLRRGVEREGDEHFVQTYQDRLDYCQRIVSEGAQAREGAA